jgi:predicted GIY-YIG superfamily endonuclease
MIDRQATQARAARPAAAWRRYYVYVVELDDAVGPRRHPRYPSLYVGQSAVPPTERLRQHKEGYRSSRYVRKHGRHLRPGLYRRFNPMATREEAIAMEQELTRRLRNRGYTVYGGHWGSVSAPRVRRRDQVDHEAAAPALSTWADPLDRRGRISSWQAPMSIVATAPTLAALAGRPRRCSARR